jgi:hypothetical protein
MNKSIDGAFNTAMTRHFYHRTLKYFSPVELAVSVAIAGLSVITLLG